MTEFTKYQYRLLTTASVVEMLQGLAWILVSISYLIFFSDARISQDKPTEVSSLQYLIYGIHFFYSCDGFTAYTWVCLISNILWMTISACQPCFINKLNSGSVRFVKYWNLTACIVCHINFVFAMVCGVMFDAKCHPRHKDVPLDTDTKVVCAKTQSTMLLMVAIEICLHCVNCYIMVAILRVLGSLKVVQDGAESAQTQSSPHRKTLIEQIKYVLRKLNKV